MSVVRWLLLAGLASLAAGADGVEVDRNGCIRALEMDGEAVAVQTDVRVPTAGWTSVPGLGSARDVERATEDGKRIWRATVPVAPGGGYRVEQTLEERDGAVHLALRATAAVDAKTEGAFFWLTVPVARSTASVWRRTPGTSIARGLSIYQLACGRWCPAWPVPPLAF